MTLGHPTTSTTNPGPHGAHDGAVAGALAGHNNTAGHTGRDAALGAGVGHAGQHNAHAGPTGTHTDPGLTGHQHQTGPPVTGGVGTHSTAPGATHDALGGKHHGGSGITTHTSTTTTTTTKPTMGDRIGGEVKILAGKVTGNPVKVSDGEVQKTEGKAALPATHGGVY